MSVSEWSLPIERGGVRSTVGEYALSAVGPGPRALRNWEIARRYGLRTAAKVQVNNTWELSTVPFVPVPFTVGKHVCNLRKRNVSALMLSWSLGGYPSPNLRVVRELCAGELPDPAEAASRVACDRYGPEAAPQVCEAWRKFTAAFASYPFHIGVLYNGPQQLGPANLLYPEPTHYRATMTGFPYDDLDSWRAIYPPDVFARQFRILSVKWQEGLAALRTAVRGVPPSLRRNARGDLRVAEACGLHFQSVADQARFVMLRDQLLRSENTTKRTVLLKEIRSLIEREEQAARRLYLLSSQDSRLGFEAANQYFFLPQDCLEKITNCRYLREVVYGSH